MPRGKTRIAMFALIGLSALLVGFHGASTLMTLTQVAASPGKPQSPKAHASLVPKPVLPVQVSEPTRTPVIDRPADNPAAIANAEPVVLPVPMQRRPAGEAAAEQPAPNPANLAAAATVQAELVHVPAVTEEATTRRERPRRYRAQRPELHRVY